MKAAVLSIGSELLRGDIVDTNAAFLARQLSELTFDVRRVIQIGDDLKELVAALLSTRDTVEFIVSTGGLGPTQDDLTREAIGAALGEEMYLDDELQADLERRFAGMRRHMPASNSRQAMLIPSAKPMRNPNGTAPGWYVEKDSRIIAALPGPPAEMQPMWLNIVRPRLAQCLSGALSTRSLMTFGLGESAVEQRIADILHWHTGITVATYAKSAGVEVHVTARAASQAEADVLLEQTDGMLRRLLGDAIFGSGSDTLASAVGAILAARGLTLSVMESATGGELGNLITNVDGSADYFLGGIISYTRNVKETNGVPPGIIDQFGLYSPETAVAMASAARERLGADIGLGITGIAGNDSLEGKPPGTCYIGLSTHDIEEPREIHRTASREVSKRYFAQCALDLLRRRLLERVEAK